MKMVALTLIFDFPQEINRFSIFDVRTSKAYVNTDLTQAHFEAAYAETIKDDLKALFNLTVRKETKVSAYFSGHFLELLSVVDLKGIGLIKECVDSGNLELLGGTFNASLSAIYNLNQFEYEVKLHSLLLKEQFGVKPTRFYNTESTYYNSLAIKLDALGFESCFAGAIEWYLSGQTHERVVSVRELKKFRVLLNDTDRGKSLFEGGSAKIHFIHLDNAMMNEMGGLEVAAKGLLKKVKPSSLEEILKEAKPSIIYNVKSPTMGSIHGRSLASYNGQAMQANIIKQYYETSSAVISSGKQRLIKEFLALGSTSIFMRLSTSRDRVDSTPYQLYSQLINILCDLEIRVSK